jgi:stearoyl-CoA desaturase (delta-9 desaturase)
VDTVPLLVRIGTLAAVLLPPTGVVTAVVLLWGWGFSWVPLGLLLGMGLLTGLGITVGYHRLFTHRSFETYGWVKFVLAAVGSMAVQGSVLQWVAYHRRHHQHSDTPDDPHTPHHAGRGVLGLVRGFWYAHVGWVFTPDPAGLDGYVRDLRQSPTVRAADTLFPLWVVLGLVIPAAIGGVLTGSWAGAILGLLWGGLVRVFVVHHVTWSVNSVCHLWGARPYPDRDHSRNNTLFGVLALGEGWHNNHHAFPTSARHGLRWWQIDVSYYVIRLFALTGLAWKVRLPAADAVLSAPGGSSPEEESK